MAWHPGSYHFLLKSLVHLNFCLKTNKHIINRVYNFFFSSGLDSFYSLSYLWYSTFGTLITFVVGLLVSFITGELTSDKTNSKALSLKNHISGVMVSLLASSTVGHGFKPRSGQTKDYQTDIFYFSAKHAALRSKNKDLLILIQDHMYKWSDISKE